MSKLCIKDLLPESKALTSSESSMIIGGGEWLDNWNDVKAIHADIVLIVVDTAWYLLH